MTGWLREFRILPVALAATVSLLALKVAGLYFDGGFTLGQRLARNDTMTVTTVPVAPSAELRSPAIQIEVPPPKPKPSWMQEMFNYPGTGDITGSVAAKPKAEEAKTENKDQAEKKPGPVDPPPSPGGTVIVPDARPTSPGERALLERLQERRQELDARARELDMRENMLKTQEKKDADAAAQKTDAKVTAEAQRQEEADNARFKAVVTMYETMKPKDAAKIFDRLDIKVLIEMASRIKPQRMSEILANMSPEAAERLTVEMAAKTGDRSVNPANLPKIDGKPGG